MKNDLEPVYGNWSGYGWGAMWFQVGDQDYIRMDFDPELLDLNDIKTYYRNRHTILALPLMTKLKFYRTISKWFWDRAVSKIRYNRFKNKTIKIDNIEGDEKQ